MIVPTVTSTIAPSVSPSAAPVGSAYTLGATIVTNGEFTTDTAWTKGSPWLIDFGDNNRAITFGGINASSILSQSLTTEDGAEYRVEVEVVAVNEGGIEVSLGGTEVIPETTGAGVFSGFITVSGTSNTLEILAVSGMTAGQIDNVVVQKVTR